MKKTTDWQGIYLAWFSRDFYSHVIKDWHGLGLKYLMIVLAVLWLSLSIKLQVEVVNYVDGFLLKVLRDCPDILLTDGVFHMSKPSPYKVIDPRSGKPIQTFDLRDNAPVPDLKENGFFFYKNKEIIQVDGKRKEFELSGSWKEPLVSPNILKSIENIRDWSGVIVFTVFYLLTLLGLTIQVFVYGLVGFAISGLLRRPLTFSQAGRVATIALLPVLLLEFLQRILGVFIPLWTVFSILLAIGYVIFGIKSASATLNRPVQEI